MLICVRDATDPVWIATFLVIAVLIAGALQLAMTGTIWLMIDRRWQRAFAQVRLPARTRPFFKRALPGLIAAGTPQLKLIAATALVSSSPAAVSWLYYANRLYELPLGIASIAVAAVIVPRIAASLHDSDKTAYRAAQSRAYEIARGRARPAATGFALLAPEITSGLFEHGAFGAADTEAVAVALIAVCSGLPGHVLEKVFGAVSFSHGDAHTPMIAALTGLATAVAGGILLFPPFGYIGVAAAIAFSGWVGAAVLWVVLGRREWIALDGGAARNLPRIATATAVMGVAVFGGRFAIERTLPALVESAVGRLMLLLVLVTFGMLIYGVAIDRLGVAKIKNLAAAIRGAT
jgi:putative peptidoglycan lipid II flippase